MNTPLVSINIPVYKCENYIYRCLDSVKNQTYKNIEIILVNDCTPDNSVVIINDYILQNPELNIKLYHLETNKGLSVVRNKGIEKSNGEYIYFLDSDDDITPDCIEKLVKNVFEYNTEMVIAQNRWINTFDNSIKDFGFPTLSKKKNYFTNSEIFQAYCKGAFPISSWNKLVRLDFIKQHKIYFISGLYAQDELWMFHCMERIESLSIIDDITYNYYLHGNSVIFNRTKKNSENHQTILEWVVKSYDSTTDSVRKKLIRSWIVNFKKSIIQMQWKVLKDEDYFKLNYNRMKKAPSLTFLDYFSSDFTKQQKKENFLLNLPVYIGFKLFKKRYEG
ncbi:glycosyltransferase family 2 protein [Empedobacter brevis]|uniref:glycosyltransferase family 2 protein n=1 Tax=Empedobacter brevis TaxID=247 RepID=UPI0028A026BB|nr:glycosyltransferase family 2 protein [Empedobacter brevis]